MNWSDELVHSLMYRPECRHEAMLFHAPGPEAVLFEDPCIECEISARNWLDTHAPDILLAIYDEMKND